MFGSLRWQEEFLWKVYVCVSKILDFNDDDDGVGWILVNGY